jgi:TonB family protein
LRNLGKGWDRGDTSGRPEPLGTIPRFELVPSPKIERRFSLAIDRERKETEEPAGEDSRKDVDFSQFNSPAVDSLRFNHITTRRGERIPTGQQNQMETDRPVGYDIAPWAKDVVDRIRNNWTLPPIDESIAMGEVKVFIAIGKQGSLIALEIVKTSEFSVFDRTTAAAIRSSIPFPPLPEDFPYDRLEAYLVFQFHE